MRESRTGLRRLVLAGALALGLVVGGGVAWAFWTVQVTEGVPPALRSGTLDLTVTGASGTLAGPGGTVSVPGLSLVSATPTASDSEVFTIVNSGTRAWFTPSITSTATGTGGLGAYLQVTVLYDATDSGAGCSGGSPTAPVLAPGASVPVCVVLAVAAGAPSSVQNQSGSASLSLTANQVQR